MKNDMTALRNHLFETIEKLKDEELDAAQLETQIKRSKAIISVAEVLVESAKVEVQFLVETGATKSGFFRLDGSEQKQIGA